MTSITVNLIENFKCKSPWYGFKQHKEKSKGGLREKQEKTEVQESKGAFKNICIRF